LQRRAPGYRAQSVYQVELDELGPLDQMEVELREQLASLIRTDNLQIPPLPQVAVELHQLASSPHAEIDQAVEIVRRDAPLAAQVMRVVASVFYRPAGGAVTSLEKAVMRIGLNPLRDIAFATLMGEVFRCPALDGPMRALHRHAFVCACGTALVCRQLGVDTHYGFLCGLMHDVGRYVIYAALADRGRRDRRWLRPDFALRPFEQLHQELGVLVVSRWKLPDLVKDAAGLHHHAPEKAGAATPMLLALAVANEGDKLDAADGAERSRRLLDLPFGYRAGLNPQQIAEVAAELEQARRDAELLNLTA